ncbi:hypothetical protein [Bradyrhizobium manausense]|nr:hypothetical protein [Bradyrhizobium manausense]
MAKLKMHGTRNLGQETDPAEANRVSLRDSNRNRNWSADWIKLS